MYQFETLICKDKKEKEISEKEMKIRKRQREKLENETLKFGGGRDFKKKRNPNPKIKTGPIERGEGRKIHVTVSFPIAIGFVVTGEFHFPIHILISELISTGRASPLTIDED